MLQRGVYKKHRNVAQASDCALSVDLVIQSNPVNQSYVLDKMLGNLFEWNKSFSTTDSIFSSSTPSAFYFSCTLI